MNRAQIAFDDNRTTEIAQVTLDADKPIDRPSAVGQGLDAPSRGELDRLRQLEEIIQRGKETFLEVGQALVEIHDKRLYRHEFSSFEQYCRQKWDISRQYGHRLIEAAQVAQELSPIGDTSLPTSECAIRPLTKLKSKADRSEAIGLIKGTTQDLRARCPLPLLMKRMGLVKYAKPGCPSPLRVDKKASWGIFERDGRWFWKDHGNGDGGDEIEFIIRAKKLKPKGDFMTALDYWERMAEGGPAVPEVIEMPEAEPRNKPDASGFHPGTDDQIDRLGKLRKIDTRGLLVAHDRGLLVFGRYIGHEVFGVTDASGHVLEVRRLDGRTFPAHGDLAERKSHAVRGSRKNWPVGIANAGDSPMILLVEGLPDLLAAFEVVAREDALDRVAPVAMLSAGSRIGTDALPYFKSRHVRIIPHADKAGHAAAVRWKSQLVEAGASKVDFCSLGEECDDGSPINDLNDYLPLYRMDTADGATEGRML